MAAGLLFGIALAVRLAFVLVAARTQPDYGDALVYQGAALQFAESWRHLVAGQLPEWLAAAKQAVVDGGPQGVLYPLLLSPLYVPTGASRTLAVAAQAVLDAGTCLLVVLAAARLFGNGAAMAAGLLYALYPFAIIAAGQLFSEPLLIFVQMVAVYLVVDGVLLRRRLRIGASGVATGLLMLRPAFQLAWLFWGLGVGGWALADRRAAWRAALVGLLAGILLVAVPWLAVHRWAFGAWGWSSEGAAWSQMYYGIYPPNEGWWTYDPPPPPKFGVESVPFAQQAGLDVYPTGQDYIEATLQTLRSTPLKAAGVLANKAYHLYASPYNYWQERLVPVAWLAWWEPAVHQALLLLGLLGLLWALLLPGARGPALFVAAALCHALLPYFASHIDSRYGLPAMPLFAIFAGFAVERLVAVARRGMREDVRGRSLGVSRPIWAAAVAALLGLIWVLVPLPRLLEWTPGLEPLRAHLARVAMADLALLAVAPLLTAVALGLTLRPPLALRWNVRGRRARDEPTPRALAIASAALFALLVGGLLTWHSVADSSWQVWTAPLDASAPAARQVIELPEGWRPPPGAAAYAKLYLRSGPGDGYDLVVRANGREVRRYPPRLADPEYRNFLPQIRMLAARAGLARADVPQWYTVILDPELLASGQLDVVVAVEIRQPGPAQYVELWGSYYPRGPADRRGDTTPSAPRVFDGPSLQARIPGSDQSIYRFLTTGRHEVRRQVVLASPAAQAAYLRHRTWHTDDLSSASGRQTGEYWIRLVVLDPDPARDPLFF